jgi:hypothetical protein
MARRFEPAPSGNIRDVPDDYPSGQDQADSPSTVRDSAALTLPTITRWCSPVLSQSGHKMDIGSSPSDESEAPQNGPSRSIVRSRR